MIQIKDNGEKLLDVKKLCPGLVFLKKEAYLRETVAKKLNEARKYLPTGITFIIFSTWRSRAKQKKIYDNAIKSFTKEKPKLNRKQVLKMVDQFVAPYFGPHISGHMTGGALDIRLYKNGRSLPMESRKLTYQENSKSIQPKLPKYLQKNREILRNALTKAGFQNYPEEFWHWSYGDYWWAKRNNKKVTIYGEKSLS